MLYMQYFLLWDSSLCMLAKTDCLFYWAQSHFKHLLTELRWSNLLLPRDLHSSIGFWILWLMYWDVIFQHHKSRWKKFNKFVKLNQRQCQMGIWNKSTWQHEDKNITYLHKRLNSHTEIWRNYWSIKTFYFPSMEPIIFFGSF